MDNEGADVYKIQSLFFEYIERKDSFYISYINMGCNTTSAAQVNMPYIQGVQGMLKVATLNYCGIMNSPFEFYCEEFYNQLSELSNIFVSVIPLYKSNFNKDKFKWNMGKIDQKIRVGRYSPMFELEIGIQNGQFLNRQQFQDKWDAVFKVEILKYKVQFSEQERIDTRTYDLVTYHSILKYVFGIANLQEALNKDAKVYRNKMRPFYELSFLSQQRKIKTIVKNLSKINADVFFFQEYSPQFYTYLNNRKEHFISVDTTKDTLIIAKETSFKTIKNHQIVFQKLNTEKYKDIMKGLWAESTAIMVVDQYILLSVHLSSKEQKNKSQIDDLKKNLKLLKEALPQYEIIIGGDLNSYLEPFEKQFNIFPNKSEMLTTIKKRTSTQGQFHKAEKVIFESKDKIISTLKFNEAETKTIYINGKLPSRDSFIPSNEHPFDHFMVLTTLIKRKA